MQTKIEQLQDQIEAHIKYMKAKLEARDWHGVCDAANDIRCLEAHIAGYKEGMEEGLGAVMNLQDWRVLESPNAKQQRESQLYNIQKREALIKPRY